jgi:hypothetical protein
MFSGHKNLKHTINSRLCEIDAVSNKYVAVSGSEDGKVRIF